MSKLVIIGSGPAGLTAAIYAARAELDPLVIEGMEPGGQLTTTTVIENWPGYVEGIEGPQLMANMRSQALRFNVPFKSGIVTAADFARRPYAVTVGDEQLTADCIIVATGASPRLIGLASEKKLMGRGVSVCATCDGFFFKKKDVLVVGGGDTALEEALFLSGLAATVTIVHRRNELRGSKIMQERVFKTPNIKYLWDSVIDDIKDTEKNEVTGALVKNVKTGEVSFHPCDGVFMALGHVPNTSVFKGMLAMDAAGFILTGKGSATNVPGVFAAGDAADPVYKQAITAAGMGCRAALDAERYIKGI